MWSKGGKVKTNKERKGKRSRQWRRLSVDFSSLALVLS